MRAKLALTFWVAGAVAIGCGVAPTVAGATTAVSSPQHAHAAVPQPGAPTNVKAVAANQAVTVSWTAPSGVKGTITYTATSTSPSATCTTTATKCTITGLTNGATYVFTVTARNSAGVGPASYPSNGATPATRPQPPTNVTAYPGPAQAYVTWTAPSNNGGDQISSYVVTPTPSAKTCTSQIISGAATTNCTVTGLTNGKAYAFTVVAVTAAGRSVNSIASTTVKPLATYSVCSGLKSNANYSGVNFSNCNLIGANLSNDNLKKANFTNANLGGANLSGTILTGATFTGANLGGVTSGGITLSGTPGLPSGWNFADGYLFGPGTNLANASISAVSFDKLNLSGANLKGISINGSSSLTNTNFSGANLQGASMNSDDFTGSNFQGANLTGANTNSDNFTGSNFQGANLTGMFFYFDTLNGVTSGGITGARGILGPYNSGTANPNNSSYSGQVSVYNGYLFGGGANDAGVSFAGDGFGSNPDLSNTNLAGASFSGDTLTGANFSNDVLTGVDFTGASLVGGTFRGADLTNAKLAGANFKNADMGSLGSQGLTELKGTDWSTVTMTGLMSGAIDSAPSKLPAGWIFTNGFLVGPSANLSGQDLTGLNLTTANVAGINFTGAILTSANLNGLDLSTVTLAGVTANSLVGTPAALPTNWLILQGTLFGPGANVESASLDKLNLSGANLKGITFQLSSLTNTNFSGANLQGASMNSDDFTGSNFQGANLTGANTNSDNFTGSNFQGANLTGMFFYFDTLNGVTSGGITGARGILGPYNSGTANPNNSSYSGQVSVYNGYLFGGGANDAGVSFAGDGFGSNPDLSNTNLAGASFSGDTLTGANFSNDVLDGADFSNSALNAATFDQASLNDVIFSGATVQNSTFGTAVVKRVVFTGAIWSADDFTSAQLLSDDLSSSDLSSDSFSSNTFSQGLLGGDSVVLPAGWSVVNGALAYNA